MSDEEISVADFKRQCKDNDSNIVSNWDKEKFGVVCKKCGSDDCDVTLSTKKDSIGCCETCYSEWYESHLLIKCHACGHAMNIKKECDD